MRAAGHATRERILAAATAEFAARGVAGARINRIATEARASKDRLYAYFPSKQALFDEVVRQWVVDVDERTAVRGDDVAGYVGRLFDHYLDNPQSARLQAWIDLDEPERLAADDLRLTALRPKIDAIRQGQADGHVDASWHPADLLIVLLGIARSMALSALAVGKIDGGPRGRDAAGIRRAAVLAAQRVAEPSSTEG
ncbi:TetR family transcriptional regulator [Saccharopolyspora gloriosae]|uniref:AcrR family transcriptional regulator n=1 Tax=Saccharopolyspora gloriosae TaxID=455344 RepID=A0A840N9R6_9PSEU|nr:TetR family transcriptional regulator [Saccharopolyspora gloriosae]MBB5068700.1 AcrR family transcriptional regulator [Saccharopolyspora gloriosae]